MLKKPTEEPKSESKFTCEKCGAFDVDVSLICQTCGWDHYFHEYFEHKENEEDVEPLEED